jgi:hypothetical protein
MTYKPVFEESVNRNDVVGDLFASSQHPSFASMRSRSPSRFSILREPSRARNLIMFMQSGVDVDYTGNEKLNHIVHSDFYVSTMAGIPATPSPEKQSTHHSLHHSHHHHGTSNNAFNRQVKLYGRQNEIIKIFSLLFPGNPSSVSAAPSGSMSAGKAELHKVGSHGNNFGEGNSSTHSNSYYFDVDSRATMVAVCGAGGTGKTALVSSIGQKLFVMSRKDPKLNVVVLQNRSSSLNSKVPLNTWRPLILDLLKTLTQRARGEGSGRIKKGSARISMKADYIAGLDQLLPLMDPENRKLKPLLLTALGLGGENEQQGGDLANMSAKVKLQKCAELIIELVNLSAGMLNKLLCFLM